jgi:hypothetical protein
MEKDALEVAIAALESSIRTIDFWVLAFAVVVALSLTFEAVFSVAHWLQDKKLPPLRAELARIHAKESLKLEGDVADAKVRAANAELALEKFKAPRTLSIALQSKITEQMKAFAGTVVTFGVFQDPEALSLLDQVSETLTSAGWVEQEWKSGGDIVLTRGGGHPIAGYTFVSGLYIQADNTHAADFGPVVQKLAGLLSSEGIPVHAEVGHMAPNTNNDAIKILIGQKQH